MSFKRSFPIALCLILVGIFVSSCKDDDSFFGGSTSLGISADTVFFDTVFTRVVPYKPLSVNKQFVVRNKENKNIKTSIFLAGDANSPFFINVDGESGRSFNDVEIRAGDSIFVFVELLIDPNNDPKSLPLIVRDSIVFNTNGNVQDVKLIAWGQDANYMRKDSIETDVVWADKEKPYLIYDYFYVKEGAKLTIEPGVRVHFAPNTWLWIEGTLVINGTKDEPVFMEGDRLQTTYDQRPNQWNGIRIHYPSKDNIINHLRIKNGLVGVFCDSISSNGNPNLIIKNSEIRNMGFDGLAGRTSNIVAENCIMTNCGRFGFFGQWGGDYDIRHCTMYTGSGTFSRRDPTCAVSNVERDELGALIRTFDLKATIANCIMLGSNEDEFGFDLFDDTKYSLNIINNAFNTTQLWDFKEAPFNNILNPKNINFRDITSYHFELEAGSDAIDKGNINLGIDKDFCGNPRDSKPDIGAFEYIP